MDFLVRMVEPQLDKQETVDATVLQDLQVITVKIKHPVHHLLIL
jgi:hypothetical protein